jgi:hypothetical protein
MASTYSKTTKTNNRAKVQSPENFLEALKSLGSNTVNEFKSQVKTAVTSDIPESFGLRQAGGTLGPNEALSIKDIQAAENRGKSRAESNFAGQLAQMNEQSRSRLIKEEAAAKQQITVIREEILRLAKTMGDFAQEVQIATMQAPANPGIYHRNFYSQLRTIIETLRIRAESSKNWLAASNSRAGKKGHYWSEVGKSGSKFMLSSERYMVTSTG